MDRCWLLSVLLALASAAVICTDRGDKERLLTEVSRDVGILSECMLSCTSQTYKRMAEIGDRRTVRFRPTTAGELGHHCWSLQVKHGPGEQLHQAYVLLPVQNVRQRSQGLRPTCSVTQEVIRPHHAATEVSEDCGLLFDVTQFYTTLMKTQSTFCVEAVPKVKDLKCPPFMVTTWARQHPSPT